jgi:hypothetical protein
MLRGLRRLFGSKFGALFVALTLMATTATAAEIKLISLRFSIERSVPHIHVEGRIEDGDAELLGTALEKYTNCAGNCRSGLSGGPRAVVSFSSQEGSLAEGIRIAELLQRHAAASYVQVGDTCLFSCAIAFLGGTGFWPTGGVGRYADRLIEPGARLGFGVDDLGGASSEDLSATAERYADRELIAQFLGAMEHFGVDSSVYKDIIRATSEDAWAVDTPSKLYAIRALLPAFDSTLLRTDIETQLRNVCAVLLARHYGTSIERQDKALKTQEFRSGTDTLDRSIKMLGVDDVPYHVTGCGTSEDELALPLEEVHVYKMVDAVNGLDGPILSIFNPRNKGWAQINYPGGSGSNPHEILALAAVREKRSVLNHLFMAPSQKLVDAPPEVMVDIRRGRYLDGHAKFPEHSQKWPMRLISQTDFSRAYESDGLVVVERVGAVELFEALIHDSDRTEVTYKFDGKNVAVRSGSDKAKGTSYYWLALRDGEQAATIRIEVMGQPWGFSAKQRELSSSIACSVALGDAKLACYH